MVSKGCDGVSLLDEGPQSVDSTEGMTQARAAWRNSLYPGDAESSMFVSYTLFDNYML